MKHTTTLPQLGTALAVLFAAAPAVALDFAGQIAADRELANAPPATESAALEAAPAGPKEDPLLKIDQGDGVNIVVYGRPDMNTTTYVADDGTIAVPLVGPVRISGLSPSQASQKVARALRAGDYLKNPNVTITLTQHRSQQVSVLGEVKTPGRFAVQSKVTVLDLIAQAGGTTENGSDIVYVLRPDKKGEVEKIPVALNGLRDKKGGSQAGQMRLKGGDSVFVPRADQFYIYGEVRAPNMYRLEPGMTVIQAIARGGGITPRGSNSRIEITRRRGDGEIEKLSPDETDVIEPDDVIRVKERIF